MKRGTIAIENNIVYYSPDSEGDVWLAQFEIAQ